MFDLMKKRPTLDIATLNYIWDTLWRQEACYRIRPNLERRIRGDETRQIMKMLEAEAQAYDPAWGVPAEGEPA
jgi:hypothetical protein